MAVRAVASIDVGSNSIKLLVARLDPGDPDHYEDVLREKEMVRLGQETLRSGRLSEEAIAAGVDCMVRYVELARAAGAQSITAVATCAVREAENGAEFVRQVKEATGIKVRVVSGEEEARLITRGVRADLPASVDPLLVVDIGGGSTEVVVAREEGGDDLLLAESLDLGAVRLTDSYVRSDPLAKADERRLRKAIRRRLQRVRKPVRKSRFRTAVGTSGTILCVADVAAALRGRPAVGTGHGTISRRDVGRAVRLFVRTSEKQKLRIPGLDPDRRDIVTAGAILLEELMDALGIGNLLVSDRSLRDGLVLDSRSASRPGPGEERNARRASVERLEKKAGIPVEHASRVRQLALSLFDQTHALHQLTEVEREWLEYAATLHEIGLAIGYSRHHHHTYYLVIHGGMKGFTRDEVEVIALIARYHRKAVPSKEHDAFRRLDPWKKPVVEKLVALMRIADGLDKTHRGVVRGVKVTLRGKRVHLSVKATGPCDLELWTARKKGALFTRVFGRKLVVRAARAERPRNVRAGVRPRLSLVRS